MAHLFWNHSKKQKKNLLSKEFSSEGEFEKYILKNMDLLGEDIFLVARQIRGGNKDGIPDIIGFDSDGNVCIVEMKDEPVKAEIIKQIFEYGMGAKQNPADLQNMWLKAPDPPDDKEIDFETSSYGVRLIVVAPEIDSDVSSIQDELPNFQIDFFGIKRWVDSKTKNEFILVDKFKPRKTKKKTIPKARVNYDEHEYAKHHNPNSAKKFWKLTIEIEKLCKKKKWPLKKKPNKNYCHMQYGFYNVFGLKWLGSKSFCIEINDLPENFLKKHQPKKAILHHRSSNKHARFEINEQISLQDYIPLFQKALDQVMDKRG